MWVTDLPGGAETDIFVAGDEDSYQIDTQTTAYRGDNSASASSGKWRVRIRGVDIDVSAVVPGSSVWPAAAASTGSPAPGTEMARGVEDDQARAVTRRHSGQSR